MTTNPKEVVTAIGVFLENLMNTVQTIDDIKETFKVDNPSSADKISITLKKFPNDARDVFKALTKICLMNENSTSSDGAIEGGEAEETMINALSSLRDNVESLRFLYNRDMKTGQEALNVLSSNFDILNASLQVNAFLLSDFESSISFEYSFAISNVAIGLKVTKDFIFKKFPSITELDDSVQKINEQKSAFDNTALAIIDSINQLYTNFRMSYDGKIAEAVKNTRSAFDGMKKAIVKLLKRNLGKIENVMICLSRDELRLRVRHLIDVILNASLGVEEIVVESSSLMELINEYDNYLFKIAKVIIRTNHDYELDEKLNKVRWKSRVHLLRDVVNIFQLLLRTI